jgi:hypothetical protein
MSGLSMRCMCVICSGALVVVPFATNADEPECRANLLCNQAAIEPVHSHQDEAPRWQPDRVEAAQISTAAAQRHVNFGMTAGIDAVLTSLST